VKIVPERENKKPEPENKPRIEKIGSGNEKIAPEA
jgi:hypothetical protein